jgi:hypothetical protein
MLGGAGCCNNGVNGGAKKRVARKPAAKAKPKAKAKAKPKAKRGGNAGDTNPPAAEPVVETVVEHAAETATEPVNNEDAVQAGGARKKKGSKVVAKRALTPYNKFVKTQFAILKKKFPDEKAPQIMQKIAVEWKKTKK